MADDRLEELRAVAGGMHDHGLYMPAADRDQFLKDNASKDEFLKGWGSALIVVIDFLDTGRWPDDPPAATPTES